MTVRRHIVMPPAVRRAIVAHAEREAPNECVGFLVGRGAHVIAAVPLQNVAASRTRYRVDDAAHLQLRRQLRSFAPPIEILGVYHSHPAGDPVPSPTDVAEAHYPDWVHVIVGLRRRARPLRAYKIRQGRVFDVRLIAATAARTRRV